MKDIAAVMHLSPVIPVLVIEEVAQAARLAETLVSAGLRALEVTLRTPAALEVLREMSKVEGAVVGAGTVLNEGDLDAALEAGAKFIVSPGFTRTLASAALARRVPFLPGVSSASEIMRGLELGLRHFKFFPAEAAGGIALLKALAAPFAQCRFCPTGGITEASAPRWLELPQVWCVGGSWIVPSGPLDFSLIAMQAAKAAGLQRHAQARQR